MRLDLNFYPEQHLDVLKGLTDLAVPQGWTLGRLIEELYGAELMLWSALYFVDDEGCVRPRWQGARDDDEERP